ncbi:ArpU family phage packaging/lysis transcriptional regulator [Paenibacillus chitinolyticus]
MQTKMTLADLPEFDKKKMKSAVVDAFVKYRIYKYVSFEAREASITAGYTERFHGSTNQTSHQTASIAVYNTDMVNMRMSRLLKRLPRLEQRLIECRYMGTDSDYIADYNVLQRATEPVDE